MKVAPDTSPHRAAKSPDKPKWSKASNWDHLLEISELTSHGGLENVPPGSGRVWGCQPTHLSTQASLVPPVCTIRATTAAFSRALSVLVTRMSPAVQEDRGLHASLSPDTQST